APNPPLRLPGAVNAVLAGEVETRFPIWWRMQVFYLVVFLQRFFPIVPRLPRETSPQASSVEQPA
ncbi:MAG: hypothetical protein ABI680_10415, partial [Chthoniobacteraceae bacterium]